MIRRVGVAAFFIALAVATGCSADLTFETGATSSATSSSGATGASSGAAGGGGDEPAATSTGSSGNDGGGGAGGAGSATSSTSGLDVSSSVSAVSTGTGADCTTADDCADDNPCTIDTCSLQGTCESVAVDPGEAGNAGEGSCPSGVCQVDATCGLSVYSHPYLAPGAWDHMALSEIWGTDEGAPPFTGIREIVPLPAVGYFLVLTDEGGQNVAHVRDAGGMWLAPTDATSYLPGLPTDTRCGYAYQPDAIDDDMVLLFSGPGPDPDLQQAYSYAVSATGTVTPNPENPFDVDRSDEAGAPPPNSDLCRWSFAVQTGFVGDPSWVVAWEGTGANVYRFDGGDSTWIDYGPDTASPIWDATGAGPATQTVVAAWLEDGMVYLVAP